MSHHPSAEGDSPGAHRILVVDDEEMIRDTLIDILDELGYEAVGASDGRVALKTLRASPERWSAILLDLTMPVMDGRRFREEQRRDAALAHIPVVVLSAYRDVAKRVEDLGVDACLAKPPSLPGLLELLGELCERPVRR
jgi:CheY-like chemotaxis protein